MPAGRRARRLALIVSAVLMLSACADVVDGRPSTGNAPNAALAVKGSDDGRFDTIVKNALTDIESFWRTEFPKVSGGRALTPLKGGLFSVDGLKVAQTKQLTGPAASNACAKKEIGFVVDNGAFCRLDDSIAWDRAPTHLFAQLADRYGPLVVALIFAHEFGHAISYRLGVFDRNPPTIDTESQADCAAGAWAATALKGQDPHFRNVTPATLDAALEGFLNGRDSVPGTPADVSHGNGFDRLSAVADGIDKGAKYCFSTGYFASRSFTERPYTDPNDYADQGNQPFSEVVTPTDNALVTDLNRFWTAAAKTVHKTFTPVRIAEATHPPCASSSATEFGYCPDDNTVYVNRTFAAAVYNSLPGVDVDPATGNVRLVENQPADFALGALFAIGWGLAVRHQLFHGSLDDGTALSAAVCYSGSYAKDINLSSADAQARGLQFSLSPSDLDEAVSAMVDQVGSSAAFGARGTSGLDRIQSFVTGYRGGLSAC